MLWGYSKSAEEVAANVSSALESPLLHSHNIVHILNTVAVILIDHIVRTQAIIKERFCEQAATMHITDARLLDY